MSKHACQNVKQGEPLPAGAGRIVLIVEDNPTNARLIVDMLGIEGYTTHVAAEGAEGFDLAVELLPDLILTDIQMSGMDGLTMTRQLKADRRTAAIPVIAVTAHAMQEHADEAMRAGCCGFITKPFRFRPFLAEVAHAIQSN